MKKDLLTVIITIGLVALLIVCAIYFLPVIFFELASLHQRYNQYLVTSFGKIKDQPILTGSLLILSSFLYGILHTIGPGHGKVVLTIYLAANEQRLKSGLKLSFIAALIQAGSAIFLTLFFIVVLQLSPSFINLGQLLLERFSYLLLIGLGLLLCYNSLKSYGYRYFLRRKSIVTSQASNSHTHSHNHSHTSCTHCHLPPPVDNADNWKEKMAVVLSIGFRPCTGAIFVLFLAYALDLYLWGIVAAIAMAIGVAISLSGLAWLVINSKKQILKLSHWLLAPNFITNAVLISKLCAGLLIILLGCSFLYSSIGMVDGGTNLLLGDGC